ncbi:MAG: 16S rRNA (cytosine(967)-C(5))-methyltransferase RsmB [Gammaproteobacteria bacterium]|nr:16S rRNA (cytosine(967)-C(5))-methyltransferase RsmB [Gammaproteobacteria bacterium]MYB37857.1 16S rRNA (cytosine(967)-C(5))-methyltransferase RsmB [Gammaproteobacteria bacterium]
MPTSNRSDRAQRDARLEAMLALARVLRGRSLDAALATARTHPQRALVFELVHGSLRHYLSLSEALKPRLRHAIKDVEVEAALLAGAYQLLHTRVKPYAAVSACVDGVRALGKSSAGGLVNAVLRSLVRLPPEPPTTRAGITEHPTWLAGRIEQDWGEKAEQVMEANIGRAPMALRVNERKVSTTEYAALLHAAKIDFRPGMFPATLVLCRAIPKSSLPGFADGLVSIQDESAQIAAHLVAPESGERVLDACAAPGGKAFHLVEQVPSCQLTAIDTDEKRLAFTRTEAVRLGHDIRLLQGDAMQENWWDGVPYDRILVDAPCSGTGTLRRRPDIKLHRTAADVRAHASQQGNMLDAVWPTLRPGGTLVYCTCSILVEENDDVVAAFLDRTANAAAPAISADWGLPTSYGRQTLPAPGQGDGFYFARLVKVDA